VKVKEKSATRLRGGGKDDLLAMAAAASSSTGANASLNQLIQAHIARENSGSNNSNNRSLSSKQKFMMQ
jgi:hypothetical protein